MHYRDAAFHVHKFVLSYHSSYFRTYIEQLVKGQRAYPQSECGEHADITHCIRLPHSFGKEEADVDDFQLFLEHLYFAAHHSCPPFPVPTEVDNSHSSASCQPRLPAL